MKKMVLLLVAIGLTGCQTPTANVDKSINNNLPDSFTHCGKKSAEPKMCTMDYNPVCGKVNTNGLVSYKTFGNACSACNSNSNVVSYTAGACGSDASK